METRYNGKMESNSKHVFKVLPHVMGEINLFILGKIELSLLSNKQLQKRPNVLIRFCESTEVMIFRTTQILKI